MDGLTWLPLLVLLSITELYAIYDHSVISNHVVTEMIHRCALVAFQKKHRRVVEITESYDTAITLKCSRYVSGIYTSRGDAYSRDPLHAPGELVCRDRGAHGDEHAFIHRPTNGRAEYLSRHSQCRTSEEASHSTLLTMCIQVSFSASSTIHGAVTHLPNRTNGTQYAAVLGLRADLHFGFQHIKWLGCKSRESTRSCRRGGIYGSRQ